MDFTRRNFLKGLMGLAAVAGLGLPAVSSDELIDAAEQYLASDRKPERPSGEFGSIGIDDTWYALHGAEVKPYMLSATLEGTDGIIDSVARVTHWTIDCVLDYDYVLERRLFARGPHEIAYLFEEGILLFGKVHLYCLATDRSNPEKELMRLKFVGYEGLDLIKTA